MPNVITKRVNGRERLRSAGPIGSSANRSAGNSDRMELIFSPPSARSNATSHSGVTTARQQESSRAAEIGEPGQHKGQYWSTPSSTQSAPQVTRHPMPVATLLEGRRLVRAARKLADRAPGVERAAGRRADRAWDVALQHCAPPRGGWVRDRHGRHQRLSVRMKRCGVEVVCGRKLDDLAKIHHRYARADVLDDREVVCNEDVGQ